MKVKIKNASSRKTREKIKRAFAELMKEKKELNKITVTDLVKIVDITRGSFYTHYDNIYEVALDIQKETLDILYSNIDQLKNIDNIDCYFDEICNYLKDNESIYTMILSSNEPLIFANNLNKIIDKILYDTLRNQNINNLELNISLFVDGWINLVIKHFRKEINYSLDNINNYIKETFIILFLNNKKV